MSIGDQSFETCCLSSLSKVFADEELQDQAFHRGLALLNETYSFQVAYRTDGSLLKNIKVHTESEIRSNIQVQLVGLVPSEFPIYHDHDDRILRSTPGLYPDPLYPLDDGIPCPPNQWRSVWITVDLNEKAQPGVHTIKVIFETGAGELLAKEEYQLEVIPETLPDQELIYTQWFHADCLATYYQVDVFSEAHRDLIDQFVKQLQNTA